MQIKCLQIEKDLGRHNVKTKFRSRIKGCLSSPVCVYIVITCLDYTHGNHF